ncbi:MAG: transketolase [Opitutales bacterium]|nr:transketolase [Opitutales bacterium]
MLDKRSKALRKEMLKMLLAGKRGHLASALSLVEIFRVLYDDILTFNPKEPKWPGRDRCILSKGHGCMALYAILADKGYFPRQELKKFCTMDSLFGGHPEIFIPGVEASTGSLGHGLSIGLGQALASRMDGRKPKVFVIVGDGEINEGSVWEAALSASKHKVEELTVIIDYNKQQSYSSTDEICPLEPLADKWRAFGFGVADCDGHDVGALKEKLTGVPFEPGRPSVLICHTVKGKGIDTVEGNLKYHHVNNFTDNQYQQLVNLLEGGAEIA